MKKPAIYTPEEIKQWDTTRNVNELWVCARPLATCKERNRFKLAWMVLTGKADALVWNG